MFIDPVNVKRRFKPICQEPGPEVVFGVGGRGPDLVSGGGYPLRHGGGAILTSVYFPRDPQLQDGEAVLGGKYH